MVHGMELDTVFLHDPNPIRHVRLYTIIVKHVYRAYTSILC